MNITGRGQLGLGGRMTALVAAGAVVLGMAAPSAAAEKESRKCRSTIAKGSSGVAKTILTNVDKCHGAQNKISADQGPCNVIGSTQFDPKAKYPGVLAKNDASIDKSCLAGDPVLDNYPPSGDASGTVFPAEEATLGGNSVLTLGNGNLGGDKDLVKCIGAVAKGRSGIVNEILKNSTKCQAGIDKTATAFGAIAPSCVDAGAKSVAKANAGLAKACDGIDAAVLGVCSPFPQCVIDSSVQSGQSLARTIYSVPAAPECGDGVITFPEQCDDDNTTPGDGCNASCEIEGNTCSPFLAARTVTISIAAERPFAGVDITLDYPQFQSGIPGTGQSSIVQSHIDVLQGTPGDYLFLANDRETDLKMGLAAGADIFDSGNILQLAFDGCLPLDQFNNICNRNQNVIGCCNGDGDDPNGANCVFAPPACTTFPLGTIGTGTPEDCCPADNACVSQQEATVCNASGAVDAVGNPVAVTCSVTVTQP
jgi:cysteine-rich repeat protein